MKKVIRNVVGYTAGILFALAPVILLISYFTYTEKVILPATMIILITCTILLIVTEEEK